MSFLWSWGGAAVGTEFEIIAGCLQGIQMLMKLLCLIIKDANLREWGSSVVTPARWKILPLILTMCSPTLSSSFPSSHLCTCCVSTLRTEKSNWNQRNGRKPAQGKLDFGSVAQHSHKILTCLPEVPFWRTRVTRLSPPSMFRKSTNVCLALWSL
jgi:hypothetical protein